MNGSLPTNQPYTYQQRNVYQYNGTYNQFDPTRSSFEPSGTAVDRWQTPGLINGHEHHDELVAVVQQQNIQQLVETARLDRGQRGLRREYDDLRHVTDTRFQALERRVTELASPQIPTTQLQIEPSTVAEPTENSDNKYEYYKLHADFTPSEEMLQKLSVEELAEAYLGEVKLLEDKATGLRNEAFKLCPHAAACEALGGRSQAEAAPTVGQKNDAPRFACCDIDFGAIGELVKHVESMHTAPEHRSLKSPPDEQIASSSTGDYPAPLVEEKQAAKTKMEANAAGEGEKTARWMPMAVRNMPTLPITIPEILETFSFEMIRTTFGGDYWSPGFYFVPKDSILPSKSYWILDDTHEPFLPEKPGDHGAKLTAFFNMTISGEVEVPAEENYLGVPVFIKTSGKDEYSYFGNYSQERFSDKVGYDTIRSFVPKSVLRNHAEQLAETGRPAWVTEALRQHFWPKPAYDGPIPTDSAINSPATSVENGGSVTKGQERRVMRALVAYAAELKAWEKDSTFKVSLLTADSIFNAFDIADADIEPGMRLFWEYLQFVGWDAGFYKMLVGMKASPKTRLQIGSAGKKRCPSPEYNNGSTAAKIGLSTEATFKATKPKKVVQEYPGPEAKTKFVRPKFDDEPVGSGGSKRAGASKTNGAPSIAPKGDLRAAKEFSASVKKTSDKSLPPHLRGRK
ncbi:uncharacterized protein RCC_05175 [Ramularia collo-cygni]|uniref:DUF6697 domain-containing protein n=1 Tax=Ramularia collo-cygni TaxID=112498 RepID=A0A2D3V3R5_9PEZI|nr:uncharacterized protein RCC_05175 [Ramularia collo-cygni]CZT19327.1 uncharacterized protein RCC_05175 [Ramularia collo-cygni]